VISHISAPYNPTLLIIVLYSIFFFVDNYFTRQYIPEDKYEHLMISCYVMCYTPYHCYLTYRKFAVIMRKSAAGVHCIVSCPLVAFWVGIPCLLVVS
jgi:hypothetical protein